MPDKPVLYRDDDIDPWIMTVRGQKVILDADLARIYEVPTKALNQAVKRNKDKFPSDFMFRLTRDEAEEWRRSRSRIATLKTSSNRSQSVTGSQKHRDPRFRPFAFTEHGAIMAATVLNSSRAVQMSVFVVRAFVRMRAELTDNRDLARKLAALEQEIKARLDVHESAIVDILRRIMDIVDPPALPEPPKKQIGFGVKERRTPYRARRNGSGR